MHRGSERDTGSGRDKERGLEVTPYVGALATRIWLQLEQLYCKGQDGKWP